MTETSMDSSLGFSIPGRNARGRIVRVGPVLNEILEAHAYPDSLAKLLGEALILSALFGSTLKEAGGQLTIQAQTQNGVVELLVVDYRGGELRGYLRYDADRFAEAPADPSLFALFGQGYLAITFDQALTGERYQGIVPLEGASLAEAAEHYFVQSEQIPSLLRIAVNKDPAGNWIAGGMLLQHLAEGEEGRERLHVRLDHPEWEHVRTLGETVTGEELTNRALNLEAVIWRLFHDEGEVRVVPGTPLTKGCRCDPAHIRQVIGQFSADEHAEMADADGIIRVNCEFCTKSFSMEVSEL
ncbi:Hsp33 family molecular chaperone HslO [Parasphingopyxis lamellibrachiae]|uniref:Molecular chaperone Hsp33 n=1 Tax=Parasphingopyxis lamellibrachiae TaxID=680125 RepID=A0A3D9FBN7_9SPHN|nr:Hsp33 family molecular chaperone HslO [Parasphingopyxis lamellibrachiae]RED15229.1 molecular chaperone Hsp33 [Parasphingopyxis lamellibrachiae]